MVFPLTRIQRVKLMENINNFIEEHQEKILSSLDILNILNHYKSWRSLCRKEENKSFSRMVLYYIAERMYWSNFPDSKSVIQLLQYAFETDGYLCFILHPTPENCTAISSTESHTFLGYFLEHAYTEKALFNGYRLPCTEVYAAEWLHPVELAAKTAEPKLLYQMLRYGALLSYDMNYYDITVRRLRYGWSGLTSLISAISSITHLNSNLLSFKDLQFDQALAVKYQNLVQCCELLLRDFPSWTPSFLTTVRFQKGTLRKKDVVMFIEVFSCNVVPSFKRHFTMPMKLQEACRLNIRRILNKKWLLPKGIYTLPVPDLIKEYLDLLYD